MGFKDLVRSDNSAVFINAAELAEHCTIYYDGMEYQLPAVLTGAKQHSRHQLTDDHIEGLYATSRVLHCAAKDLGGFQPEKGMRIEIDDGSGAYRAYYVGASTCEMGMLRVELEAIEE